MSDCLNVHQFSKSLCGTTVHFHVLQLKDSFFVWIGTRPELNQLAIAMHSTEMGRGTIASSALMGDFSDVTSHNLAARLAKRTGKQVLVSCNLQAETGVTEKNLTKLAEETLHEEMEKFPDKF